MKDQKHQPSQNPFHDRENKQGESHSQKDHPAKSGEKHGAQTSKGASQDKAAEARSQEQDRRVRLQAGNEASNPFHDLDHGQLEQFNESLEKDEALRGRFQQDPQGVLKEHGIELPEGYKATYDHQYVKPSDGSRTGMFGYRVGNINFSK